MPVYLFPTPTSILTVIGNQADTIAIAWFVTTSEALTGLIAAVCFSFMLGLATLFSPVRIAQSINTTGVVLQSIPILAIAPLLNFWLGQSFTAKAAAAAIVCFFPLLTGWLAGFRSVNSDNLQLFENIGASSVQKARYLMVPMAMPYFFGGLRIAMPLALLGAIVAEFVGASQGLGFQILNNSYYLRTPEMFAYLITTGITGWVFTILVSGLEKRVLFWHGETRIS